MATLQDQIEANRTRISITKRTLSGESPSYRVYLHSSYVEWGGRDGLTKAREYANELKAQDARYWIEEKF